MQDIYNLQYRQKYILVCLCVVDTSRVDDIDSGRKAT